MNFSTPELLNEQHPVETFDCGVASLNEWLVRRALANQIADASRTFVICKDRSVVGYYALAAGSIGQASAIGRFRRNMPDPVPVAILARLAIDRSCAGRGLGRALFRDAGRRVLTATYSMGIRGMIVHAISEEAKAFYLALGLEPSPIEPMTLMVTLSDLRRSLSD